MPYRKLSNKREAILTERWKTNMLNEFTIPTKNFEFKPFKDIRELLSYLNLSTYVHLFSDKGLTHFTDFYLLTEEILKKILVPKAAR